MFTSREIAISIWFIVLLFWVQTKVDLRPTLMKFTQILCRGKFLVAIVLGLVYVVGCVWLLWRVGLWGFEELKDTILWVVLSAFDVMFLGSNSRSGRELFWRSLRDVVRVTVIVEFVVTSYTFPLAVELVIVPLVSLIALLSALADTDLGLAVAGKTLNKLLAICGLVVFGYAVFSAIQDSGNFLSLATMRSFLLVPCLVVMAFPFSYAFALLAAYESLFTRLAFGAKKDKSVIAYARRRLLIACGLGLSKVRQASSGVMRKLMNAATRQEVDNAFATDSY